MDSATGRPYLNVRETAAMLGVHENTIRNWVKTGVLVSSRVPGSSTHRFAREEVQRVQRQRGASVSSVAPTLRTDRPELVSANELARWAEREDSKGAFPELMRRLLEATPGISDLEVRTHEGTAAHGWDGRATSSESPYLPIGKLRFEFGTNQDPKAKAQRDYDQRVMELPADADAIFVFATPRNWGGAAKWAADREGERRFRGVKAIDAHILEAWLQTLPSVHYWISERMGFRPRDAQTIDRWWREFSQRTNPTLPAAFYLAGRASQADQLRTHLTSAPATDLSTVRANWRDEAIAFIFAALESEPELIDRVVLASERIVWDRLVESSSPLILVPLFTEGLDLKAALDRGHRVILSAGSDDVVRTSSTTITLRKIDHGAAREALKEAGPGFDEAGAMVALARRSMSALFRSIARDPRFQTPAWLTLPEQAATLAPLVLIGTWSKNEGDLRAIETLTGRSRDDIDRLLNSLADRPDAPFIRSGGLWRLTSPSEAALLLLPKLTAGDLARWAELVPEVLLEPDPFRGMDAVARLTSSAQGTRMVYSETLKKGLSEGLLIAGATSGDLAPELEMQAHVDRVIHQLLEAANADKSGETWERLASALPDLAEASPEVFQDAIDNDLGRTSPILGSMFKDRGGSMFGPSSPHPNLLWALERLCWSPLYFGRATTLLARLASLDPGGGLSNRPIESLKNISLGWRAQSGGGVEDKLLVIERLLSAQPVVGWQLLLAVWPDSHMVSFSPQEPRFRDWAPAKQSVSYADWGHYIHELARLAIAAAGSDAKRWQDLIPKIDEVPPEERHEVVGALRNAVDNQTWTAEERHSLWDVLRGEADRHTEYSDAEWAMPAEDIALFRSIADDLEQEDDARRFSTLFDWRARVPGLRLGQEGYDDELKRLQSNALAEVLRMGRSALESLVLDVKTPHTVGYLLAAQSDAPDHDLLVWLNSTEPNLRQAALVFAGNRINQGGLAWLRQALDTLRREDQSGRELLMGAVPFSYDYWTEIEAFEPELQAAYWRQVGAYGVPKDDRSEAVSLLIDHKRAWEALELLSLMLHDKQEPNVELVKKAFQSIRTGVTPPRDVTMSGYNVGQLLEYMERLVPDDKDLPGFEFFFFELLHDHQPSRALYRALGRDPEDFVNMVKSIFRGEGEAKRTPADNERAFARLSYSVLREWRDLPGLQDDGTIDAQHLTEWVRAARLALSDSGRGSIGDEQIGQILATSPRGTDGIWPAEPVREIIESIGNARIDTGVSIGRTNQRGVTSRDVFEGGEQERVLEKEYRNMATAVATRWPRTARILRGIAEDYLAEARHNDARAERMADDG